MHESYKAGKAVGMKIKTVAAGLAPPMAGTDIRFEIYMYILWK